MRVVILTSPAKTFAKNRKFPRSTVTQPRFLAEASVIVRSLKLYSKRGLADVLEVSESLADLNYDRFRSWKKIHTVDNSRPALYAYHGDIFDELDLSSYKKGELEYARNSLFIISGLYGLLRATDLIQPYRAEMKLPLKIGTAKNLVDFWKDKVTKVLKKALIEGKHELVLNLASKEYSKAVNFSELDTRVINIDFKQNIKGRVKNYGLLSKRARGVMVDYCIKKKTQTIDDIKKFKVGGYRLERETRNTLGFVKQK